MDNVATGVVAGVLGTLTMDSLNFLFSRIGMVSKIDVAMIGRMAAGWARGRFRYEHPSEMKHVANETLYGFFTHYAIGVGLAGWLSPEGIRAPLSALANHLFYGVGIAAGIALF